MIYRKYRLTSLRTMKRRRWVANRRFERRNGRISVALPSYPYREQAYFSGAIPAFEAPAKDEKAFESWSARSGLVVRA